MNRVRKEDVRRRAGIKEEFSTRVDQSVEMIWTHGENG